MNDFSVEELRDAGLTVIDGLQCYGIKEEKNGLGVIKCRGKITGVFTRNRFIAAPLVFTKEVISKGEIEGIIVNSGNANAFTGEEGIKNAIKMAQMLAERFGCPHERIAVASTGVIGKQLDMVWIEGKVDEVISKLGTERECARAFAKSIMTTDRYPKEYAVKVGDVFIAGVTKGAGMIAPNMATMLSFIFTDADFDPKELKEMLINAVDISFNLAVVDGDTSTNDMVLLVATGRKKIDREKFQKGLNRVCYELARMIVRDGEGSTKLFEVHVMGAKSEKDALRVAKAVVSSLLVKTAVFGNDPNWGRIVVAVGYSGIEVDEKISILIEGGGKSAVFVDRGNVVGEYEKARKIMEENEELKFRVNLHRGVAEGYAIGCDLSYDYVRINAEYTT
ncbi:MAG TPA: bifunctional ornithine acetyltransferase/N-acetylglutamate synthase [Archaeoglobaceae archaeon]|nr:bifunctional ornithine acetyltransferase/N-acetylglutamate synthase [Archaeoglobaceae archaeon]